MESKRWSKQFKLGRFFFGLTLMRHAYNRGDFRYVLQTNMHWDTKPKHESLFVKADPELERLLAEEEEIEFRAQSKPGPMSGYGW